MFCFYLLFFFWPYLWEGCTTTLSFFFSLVFWSWWWHFHSFDFLSLCSFFFPLFPFVFALLCCVGYFWVFLCVVSRERNSARLLLFDEYAVKKKKKSGSSVVKNRASTMNLPSLLPISSSRFAASLRFWAVLVSHGTLSTYVPNTNADHQQQQQQQQQKENK